MKNSLVQKSARGFSLLEVLIALVIISIGLLGIASLQINSLKNNQMALSHGQASYLAYEIIDLMRANQGLATSGSYEIAIGSGIPNGITVPEQDLRNWKLQLANSLPNGDGSIDVDPATNRAFVVIQWDEAKWMTQAEIDEWGGVEGCDGETKGTLQKYCFLTEL